MKKTLLFIACIATLSSGAQDTLRNFNPLTQTPTAAVYTGIHSGYYTGHNSVFDEEWAEKYYTSGANEVVGILAYHTGSTGTYTADCDYKVYAVGANGLPAAALGTRSVAGSLIDISGAPYYVSMNSPVRVSDSFFVSFNLGDYAHHSPGTKKLALKHGPDGSRSTQDTLKYARNAIRWHSHSAATWKDFYKENDTRIRTHLAIFPVMKLRSTDVRNYVGHEGFRMGAIYPNPALSNVQLKITGKTASDARFRILDGTGRVVLQWDQRLIAGEHTIQVNISSLAPGQYVLVAGNDQGQLGQVFIKK